MRARHGIVLTVALLASWLAVPRPACPQNNFEIQVYPAETVTSGATMIELHTNSALKGTTRTENRVVPSQYAVHETIEITHGFTEWLEIGFYIFTSVQPDTGWEWVGDHLRPRVRIPERWQWPVGLSLSLEVGYQRREFSTDTWTLELRPIIDRQLGPWYFAFNPALERALKGENSGKDSSSRPAPRSRMSSRRRSPEDSSTLWIAWPAPELRSHQGTAASDLPDHRPESRSPVAGQRRRGLRADSEHRCGHREADPRPPLRTLPRSSTIPTASGPRLG